MDIFYFKHINSIGGVETFYYYLAKKYGDRNFTIYYEQGDAEQIARLRELVPVKKWRGEEITCETAFFNYEARIIDHVYAKRYVQIIHANFAEQGKDPNVNPKIEKYLAVSQAAADGHPQKCDVVYNPIVIDKGKKVVRLVSATRLTGEKGRARMEKLAAALDRAGIVYTWEIFTNEKERFDSPNIILRPQRLDIMPFIRGADYLIQLSDSEAYCFAVVEALCVGVPVIVTPCKVYGELGLNESNSIMVPFDMSEIPVDKIAKGLKKFKYTPPADKWGEYLTKEKSTYNPKARVRVVCVKKYHDIVLDRIIQEGERLTVPLPRAELLKERGFVV